MRTAVSTGRRPAATRREGFTLVEMMISITLLMIAMGIAIPFFLTQSRALAGHSGRLDAQLNADFGLDALDRDLRVAGVGIVSRQPLIVQAQNDAVTFNVDLTSRSLADFGTVYYDPDADPNSVVELTPSNRITLPNSAWTYPDSLYYASAGVPSNAETISYWVESDPSASGRYRLMRRVNNLTPRILSRGIILPVGEPMFRYFKLNSAGALVEIGAGQLPLRHLNGWHGAAADTAASALTDSIRLVKVKITTVHRDPRYPDVTRSEERSIRLMNSGLNQASTCGDSPLAGGALGVVVNPAVPSVTLTWVRSTDEAAGEKDVERYAIYRKANGAATFGEPIASVAAGLVNYTFVDTDVQSGAGQQWVYGVAAQDCTPSVSPVQTSVVAVIP